MKRREAAIGLLLAAPAVMGLLAFLVLPFGYTFLRSFTVGLGWGRFVGLENYAQLFGNRLFLLALKNTFLFLACGLALILPLSLFLALLLQKAGKWGKPLALALLFPMVLPVSAIVIVVNLVFGENGLLSQITGPYPWMDSSFAFVILLGLYLWKNVGMAVVILLAGLGTIPRELYESAHMDGAGRWARLTKVILPMLRPELLVVTILSSLNAFKNFREAFVLGGDHPHESIYMLQHFMNNNFENMNFPRLSVAAVVFFALLFCLYALLLKSPLGRGEAALETGSRRNIPPKKGPILCLTLISLLFVLPVVMTVACSFLSPQEVERVFAPLLGEGSTAAVGTLPQGFSFMGYYEVFFATPDYLAKFWVSLLLSVGAILGQMVISCMGGFAFAFYDFPGKKLLYGLLCLFMLIPLQVTLLPNYLLLDLLGVLNTYWALLLPLAFAPLGTFLLTQIFRSVPVDILHAARLDGAGTFHVLGKVLLPCSKGGGATLIVLTLIESWNMVEQPLIYLQDVGSYPLSVFLASQYMENLPFQFVCSVLSLLPLALCFFYWGGGCVGQWDSQGGEGMKPVILKVSFALLLVLALCTIAAYHIEQLMMAKVTVSVPQDEIVRGTSCEGSVLPLSSLTMRDGNTGVYIIDYVEGAFGEEMVARFVPITVEAQDQRNFSSGDLFDFREYVVSSNRTLKDGEEVAAP